MIVKVQLYGCVVLCYANSVIRWHFSPVDLFQLPGDLTEIKTDRPSFGIFTHQVRKQARIVFGPFSVQRITQTWRRGALPIPVSPVYQCIFPSCCRGRTTDAGSIICPSPKDARPLWEPGWPPSSHSSHLNAFTAPGADCDGSFPRKSARNSRPAPLGALRPFLILKKQERSAGFTESHPGATPPVSSRADATGMQAPYPGQCAHPSGHHGPPGFSFLRPRAGLHSLNGLPRPPTHLRGRMVRSQHLTMRPKRPWPGSSAMGGTM